MISYRHWKSSSASSLQSLPTLSTLNNGSTSYDASSSVRSNKRSSSLVLLVFQIAILLICGSLLIMWERPEDYVAKMDPDNRKKAAICAIQKGGLKYLDEWIQYHLLAVGFADIYLYDNSEDFELQAWHQAYDPKLQGKIHIQHFPGHKRQNRAYDLCARQIQKSRSHGWIAFVDIDEFVVLRNTNKHPYISDFLQSLPSDYGGLAMNWVVILLNNQTHYQDLPVTLRFQNRSEKALHEHIKTIARTEYFRRVPNPHFVYYLLFRPWIHTYDTKGNQVHGAFNPALADEEIALYHYQTKSLEEYKERCSRGRADKPKKEWNDQFACKSDYKILSNFGRKPPELIKDDAPWKLLKERVPAYANKFMTA